jgi:hypothetical protein
MRESRKVKMFATKIFPSIIIALSIGAGIVYAVKGDARLAVYWFAAAILNIAVTY